MDWGDLLGKSGGGALAGSSFGPWGAAIGGGVGLLESLLGDDPNEAATNKTNEAWNDAKQYQQPFLQGGIDQRGLLNQATSDLLSPQKLQDQWISGYQNSPWAKQLLSQNQSSGMDAASAMGLGGSSAALSNIQQGAGNIVNEQRQQYMNDLMQKYMQGIGLGENLYGVGAHTAMNLGNESRANGNNLAALAYNGANQPWQNLASGAGSLMGSYTENPSQVNENWKNFLQ